MGLPYYLRTVPVPGLVPAAPVVVVLLGLPVTLDPALRGLPLAAAYAPPAVAVGLVRLGLPAAATPPVAVVVRLFVVVVLVVNVSVCLAVVVRWVPAAVGIASELP